MHERKLLTALFCLSLSAAAEAPQPPAHFAAMAYLAGHCWLGQFPGGKLTDEHCYDWVYGGYFLRDRHVVRGGPEDYFGETMYAWDAKRGAVVYQYWDSTGGTSHGETRTDGNTLLFPADEYVNDGEPTLFRAKWKRLDDDRYEAVTEQEIPDGWKEIRRIVYRRR
jgi:hypothetical protein